jgi:uncharacterized protein (UPF0254 family)
MDAAHPRLPNLAARMRRTKVDERVAALLAAAVADELGAEILRDRDAAAGRRLTELVQAAARQAGTTAVNKLVLEVLAFLDEAPDLRNELARLHPEAGLE